MSLMAEVLSELKLTGYSGLVGWISLNMTVLVSKTKMITGSSLMTRMRWSSESLLTNDILFLLMLNILDSQLMYLSNLSLFFFLLFF